MEFYTWAPLRFDSDRLRFARILLESPPGVTYDRLKLAAQVIRRLVHEMAKLEAIPLADAPHAVPLREWLHTVANRAAALYPNLISTERNTHLDGRVHLHVSSNAPGHYSALPYSLRAQGCRVCTPVHWNELDTVDTASAFTDADMAARLHEHGDIFAKECARLAHQRFGDIPEVVPMWSPDPNPHGHIINAAIEILSDCGKALTSQEILDEALKRRLVPPQTQNKYVYSALIEYIARQKGRDRKPPIVQDERRRFRINEPPDTWPDIVALPQRPVDEAAQALCDRLTATAKGPDPTAFETAVCDALAHLGFLTQHFGERGQPDGVADAVLGSLGYRVLLECKTATSRDGVVPKPDAMETAKFRDAFHADKCLMIAPLWPDLIEFLSELRTHEVTAMAVPELQTLLHLGANALEVKRVLEPGFACDVIFDVLWNRKHGEPKHVAATALLVQREGWKAQLTAASEGGSATAPRLTVDAAMLVVDEALRAAGSTQACTREEVAQAFAWLSSPNVALATMENDALVVLTPPV